MAKFKRFDPRNKKRNKHKYKSKNSDDFKRIKRVDMKKKYNNVLSEEYEIR